jgi:hypothetical protein
MLKLGLILVVPYLAVASVATGAVDGTDTFDAIQNFVSQVSEQSDEVATALVDGPGDLDDKVTLCHLPGGDPEKAHLLSVSLEAVAEHEGHGDYALSDPALLAQPLIDLCADDTEVVSDEQSDDRPGNGKAPEHSNAGGSRGSENPGSSGGDEGNGGPPPNSNAGGSGSGKPGND